MMRACADAVSFLRRARLPSPQTPWRRVVRGSLSLVAAMSRSLFDGVSASVNWERRRTRMSGWRRSLASFSGDSLLKPFANSERTCFVSGLAVSFGSWKVKMFPNS